MQRADTLGHYETSEKPVGVFLENLDNDADFRERSDDAGGFEHSGGVPDLYRSRQ